MVNQDMNTGIMAPGSTLSNTIPHCFSLKQQNYFIGFKHCFSKLNKKTKQFTKCLVKIHVFPGKINGACLLVIVFNSKTANCHLGNHEIHKWDTAVMSIKRGGSRIPRLFQSNGYLLGGGCYPQSETKCSGRFGMGRVGLLV